MPRPPPDPDVMIAALLEADRGADREVAERYGVSRKTISDWRQRVAADPELAKKLAAARRAAMGWRAEAERTYIAVARAIRTRAENGDEVPFPLIATAKTYGAALLQADALLGDGGDEEDDDGEA